LKKPVYGPGAVEETLNALLEAEADRLCGAGRYERTQGRQDTRAGSYERLLPAPSAEDPRAGKGVAYNPAMLP
jgi:hypothetical protein